ncbi:hypothetical protein [Gimesia algae]|uniref:Uncharacterized protein n=1 Tax=Gimesia algae TaxID=2527971 RepID=A0A517VB66_9PLAN|nr:hypothetical protein [Gimesia algae]QDT90255.1 hypothetical protein Pan161_19050 [Gimesia algae]
MRQWFNKLICLCFAVTILIQTLVPCAACCSHHHEPDAHWEATHVCHHHGHANPAFETAHQIPDSHCPFCVCGVKRNLVLTPNKTPRLQNPNLCCLSSLLASGDQTFELAIIRIGPPNDTYKNQCSIVTALGRHLI